MGTKASASFMLLMRTSAATKGYLQGVIKCGRLLIGLILGLDVPGHPRGVLYQLAQDLPPGEEIDDLLVLLLALRDGLLFRKDLSELFVVIHALLLKNLDDLLVAEAERVQQISIFEHLKFYFI